MDRYAKFIQLFGSIFLAFVGFFVVLALIILGLRYMFGVLDYLPWFSVMFTLFIICVPALLFITVYFIYFKLTKSHPSRVVQYFSYAMFSIALAAWAYFWIADFVIFFKKHYNSIGQYNCFNLAFLAANVGLIFFIGIVQALTTNKEKDWMERNEDIVKGME
ncbi:MAG: hypothetical protein ABL929_08245 [Ferruginibacter sp.]|nr:hypothetical protein [Ferruginibacter sp.]